MKRKQIKILADILGWTVAICFLLMIFLTAVAFYGFLTTIIQNGK